MSGKTMRAAELIYGPLTPLYDVVCGALLHPGRRRAIAHLDIRQGDRILEVGVGTGHGLNDYPKNCSVVAVDLSLAMMSHAKERLQRQRREHVSLLQVDATHLAFADHAFDRVYVPYTINVVPDALAVGRELIRVCKPGGRIVLLNHFDGVPETTNWINALAGRLATAADVNWHLHLDTFVEALGLRLIAVESVNVPRLSTIAVCQRPPAA